ncbi:MAG: glycosyltransferase [Opitutaceae bacterium]
MKISIVTPCHDRFEYLESTLSSVLNQAGDFEIQYIVQNAGSSPRVREILDRWADSIDSGSFQPSCRGIDFRVFHEPDSGMYEGLNRGFARTDGEAMAWINTDDLYHPGAFQTVTEVLHRHESVYWLTGIPNSFNRRGSRTGHDTFPRAYSREFIRRGLYRFENLDAGFNWIAQDCCFWRSVLWKNAGGGLDESMRYAADFRLWQVFAEHADLVKVNSFLGGYRFHGDQVTANPETYASELPPLQRPPPGWQSLHKWLTLHPDDSRLFFNPEQGKPWIEGFGLDWDWLVGRTASFNFGTDCWDLTLLPII